MCPLVIQALLCAAAAAATSHVVDNFTSTEGMFTLTSQVPPVSTTEVKVLYPTTVYGTTIVAPYR